MKSTKLTNLSGFYTFDTRKDTLFPILLHEQPTPISRAVDSIVLCDRNTKVITKLADETATLSRVLHEPSDRAHYLNKFTFQYGKTAYQFVLDVFAESQTVEVFSLNFHTST